MASDIVGALAVELGLNTAEFEKSLKSLPGLAQKHFSSMSAEMKRTTREGAESMRLIDEALGIHISRPIARILAQEFPQLAQGLQSLLGAGVALGVGLAAFEFISKAVEDLQKHFEAAKKAQEEYEVSARHLSETLQDVALAHEKRMLQLQAEIDSLTGNKGGALENKIKIASIEDADLAVKEIDRIAEAMERAAKAAQDAETASHRFWLQAARANTSEHNLTVESATKTFDDFKEKLKETSKEDALKGTHDGLDLAIQKAKELDKQLGEMQERRISDFRAFGDDLAKAFGAAGTKVLPSILPASSGFTDKEITQIRSQDQEAHKLLETLQQTGKEHEKHLQVLKLQSATTADIGEKEITKLKSETEAQLLLAASTSKTTAEQKLAQAAGEADQIIARIQEEAHGRLTSKMKEELLTVQALTAQRLVAKDAVQTNSELEKQVESVQRQITAERELASAYAQGGVAIENAKIDQRLSAQILAVQKLRDEYNLLKKAADDYVASTAKLGSAAGPKPGLDISTEHISQVKTAVDEAEKKLSTLRLESLIEDQTKYQTEINQTARTLADEQPYLDRINEAYSENAEAVRRARVDLALYHWEQAHPGPTVAEAQATLANPAATAQEQQAAQTRIDQIQQVNTQLNQQSIIQQRQADAQLAAHYNIVQSYDDEIARLERAREVLQQYGADTLAIDAAILEERQKQLKQWDDAALKVGTFKDKYQAVMNELVIEGENAGAKIADAFLGGIRSSEDELAKFLTGQKVQPQRIIQGLAEQVTKSEIQHTVGEIAGHLGITLPGTESKIGSAASNPMYVAVVNQQPGTESKIGSAASNPMYVAVVNQQPGVRTELNQLTGAGSRTEVAPAIGFSSTTGPLADLEALTAAQIQSETIGTSPTAPGSAAVGKPDGSTSNPYHVINSIPSVAAPAAAQGNYVAPPAIPAPVSSSLAASGLSLLLSGFAGFRASGGPTESGKSYVVGENGPELFRSSTSGSIIPNSALPSSLGPPSLIPSGNASWTFDPHASYAQPYEAYERWLHRGQGSGGLFSSLGLLGGLLFKTGLLERIFHHSTSTGAIAAGLPASSGVKAELDALTASVSSAPAVTRDELNAMTAAMPTDIAARAAGGPVDAGSDYLVGEKGPELFRSSSSSVWSRFADRFTSLFHSSKESERAIAATGLPSHVAARTALDALTVGASPSPPARRPELPLPNMTKLGDVDAPYLQNWAREYTPSPGAMAAIAASPAPALPSTSAQPPSFVNLPKFSSTSDFAAVNLDGFRATGGPVGLGKTYMVGENGPELFRPSADGHIIPNHMLHLLNPVAPAMPAGVSDFAGFMADGGDVFAGRSYVVGERGREAYNFPAVSEVNSSDNRDYSQRGGDTYNIHQHINENSRDLFNRTSSQLLNALKKR